MNLPTSGFEEILGTSCVANFAHIKRLYALEEDKTLKVAHALKKCFLIPSNIVKTSPQHALSKYSKCTFLLYCNNYDFCLLFPQVYN